MKKEFNYSEDDFDEFELEIELDCELFEKNDFQTLLEVRKNRLDLKRNNIYDHYKYAEALLLNKKFEETIEYLKPLYHENPEWSDIIDQILQALYGLGKTENDFKWINSLDILKIDSKTIQLCTSYLKNKRKWISLTDIYLHLENYGERYLVFDEDQLAIFLINHDQFEYIGDKDFYFDLKFKLRKLNT